MTLTAVLGAVAVAGWCAALCWFDIRERRLPNALTVPVAVIAVLAAVIALAFGHPGAALGVAVWTVVNAVAFLARSMGAGDVKLAPSLGALVGAVAGPAAVLIALLSAQLITLVWAAVARDRTVPHGPAMCASALAVCGLVWCQRAGPFG